MNNEKLILTDVDGCILDWETQLHKWMEIKGHQRTNVIPNYWVEHQYTSISIDEARRSIQEFNTSAWLIDLPAFRDARSGIARLVDEGYKFHAITAMGRDPYTRELRQMNLDRLFGTGVFVDLTVVNLDESKESSLSKYKDSGLPWIEDKFENAVLGADLGLDSFLMNHLSNAEQQDPRLKRVNSWTEICEVLLG